MYATPYVSLVVEPHDDTRALYVDRLQTLGCETLEAPDGAVGLSKALLRPPQLLLTELRLPRIDGPQLIEMLRRESATTAMSVVIVTADARKASLDQARRARADAVYTKPVEFDTVFARLEQLIQQKADIVAMSHLLVARVQDALTDASHILLTSRTLTRSMGRYMTKTPPEPPPALHCTICDASLHYQRSHIGGVNKHQPEQWDYYECPNGCGAFQYRHRTRKLRLVV